MNGTHTNGHSALEENTKNVAMQVYHSKTVENENKPSTEVDYKNIAVVTGNNNTTTPEASNEQIETNNIITEAAKPKDGIYELCNTRREKLLPFLNNNTLQFEKLARSFAWEINTNDKLKCCSKLSMINAFYKCCEYGLDQLLQLVMRGLFLIKGLWICKLVIEAG